MVRHSVFTSMFKLVIALLTALVFVGIGGVTVAAGAHDCGCQEDNSGPGSTDSGSGSSGSDSSGSGSSGPDNSGPGNACHDNSGSGSSGPDNSGPGNAGDDCPVDEPDDPDDPGDSGDPGNGPSTSGSGSGEETAAGTVVLGAEASTGTSPGAAVPTAVNAGLTGGEGEESPSALAGLAILLGLAITFVAVRRRTGG